MIKDKEIEKIYNNPLPATRTGLFYNTFAYPTKISPETVAIYIATHTSPGDTVLDVFGGSGSTGLATLMCEHPTDKMINIANNFKISPVWGARNAFIYEIGKYGSFASNIMCNPPVADEFESAARDFFSKANQELGWLYSTKDLYDKEGVIRHVVWSDMLVCPQCQEESNYYEITVEREPIRIKNEGVCPHCGYSSEIGNYKHKLENVYDDLLDKEITRKKRVPVLIYGQTGTKKWVRPVEQYDLLLLKNIDMQINLVSENPKKIKWGELYRSGYHTGITHLHHFYTKRNYYVMTKLWELTEKHPAKIRDALRLILLSYNATHSTLMTRVVVKKNGKDFVLTGAQSGVLYISSLPVEKNILIGAERKLKNFIEAFRYVNQCSGKVEVANKSSENLTLPNNTIDYVFTDPPFGDYIPYAEVNQINELWLGKTTEKKHEVIISSSQNKDVNTYKKMMTSVFCEINRVLKDGSKATVVFHSSKTYVWEAVSDAFESANLFVENTSFLNKTQASFKQIVSKGSVQGDLVILISKGAKETENVSSIHILDEIINESIADSNSNVRIIYSRYLARCLEKGIRIKLGAKEAYDYASQKIGEL